MYYAVILAGGTGSRMGIDRPKQLLPLCGSTVLEHSVAAFVRHAAIAAIIIVVHPSTLAEVEDIVRRRQAAEAAWAKVCRIVTGGATRAESSLKALEAIEALRSEQGEEAAPAHVLFHDAARPLVSQRIITDVCQALRQEKAVNVGVAMTDTVVRCIDGIQTETPPRDGLFRVQTPQGFCLDTICQAYARAMADPAFQATDDCGIVLRYLPHTPIRLVEGDEKNLKLTYASDIPLFEMLLARAASPQP
ncbi:MAG: 2-C-methyl-D-erythritol 4-phosphate cytidylyltransferase [Alloprevotella sp.]